MTSYTATWILIEMLLLQPLTSYTATWILIGMLALDSLHSHLDLHRGAGP